MTDKRPRWTILDVEIQAIKIAKRYARRKGYTMGTAVADLIKKGAKEK